MHTPRWLLGIFALIVAFGLGFTSGYFFRPRAVEPPEVRQARQVEVPQVLGLSLDRADQQLQDAGLCVRVLYPNRNEEFPFGVVIGQRPLGGSTVSSLSGVDLVVSRGSSLEAGARFRLSQETKAGCPPTLLSQYHPFASD